MGIYDRDYERGDSRGEWRPEGSGIQLRWPTTTVGWVLLVTIGVYLAELPFGEKVVVPINGQLTEVYANSFIDLFHLEAQWYLQPWKAYGLLTYGFLHAGMNLMHVAGNMFAFWLFGRELEQRYGSREFLWFYLVSIVLGGLAFTGFQAAIGDGSPVIGASAGTVAVTILYAFNFPQRTILFMFFLPMPMWMLGCLIVGQDIFRAVNADSTVAYAAHLGGAAFAFAYHKRRWRLADHLPESLAAAGFKRRPKLRVFQDDTADDAASGDDDRLDELLRKVHRSGLDSLSRREKAELERASRRSRNRPK